MAIADVAKGLLASYAPYLADRRLLALPDQSELEKALQSLVGMGLLAVAPGVPVNDIVKNVANVVKRIQGDSGILDGDGILGIKTMKWLLDFRGCVSNNRQIDPATATSHDPTVAFNPRRLNYFIEMVPSTTTGNPLKLIKQAFENWMEVCSLEASRTYEREFANVIVMLATMDGTGNRSNTLADAHQGTPDTWGNFQAQLRFDKDENWTEAKFLTTATHEIGHLMGLEHTTGPDRIMNALLNNLAKPGAGDKEDLRRLKNNYWGVT